MWEIIPRAWDIQGNKGRKKWDGKRGEKAQPESLAAVGRAVGDWHFSMWLAYGANCGSSTVRQGARNQRRSGWLWQTLPKKGKADGTEGWYRCQSLPKSAICHGELAKSQTGPPMRRKQRESRDDYSLWVGSCPFNMANNQTGVDRGHKHSRPRSILSVKSVLCPRSMERVDMFSLK